jgi:hypothetical protein
LQLPEVQYEEELTRCRQKLKRESYRMTCPQEALESSGIFLELWKAICMYI